ncbi:MAG: phage tail protein [Oceanospirillaceae bacterium]|nr:phage tail protein [Oceanospirillaceae bacterium]
MKKPAQLRDHLLASVAHLQRNPDSLLIYIASGTLHTRLLTNLNFDYNYQLQIIVTDFAEHPNAIIVPLLAWLKHHQIDLKEQDIKFEADIIRKDLIDLQITLPLNECVIVNQDDQGRYSAEHLPEPIPEYNQPDPDPFQELFHDESNLTNG